jgi:hypothetical protein
LFVWSLFYVLEVEYWLCFKCSIELWQYKSATQRKSCRYSSAGYIILIRTNLIIIVSPGLRPPSGVPGRLFTLLQDHSQSLPPACSDVPHRSIRDR